MPPSPLSDLAVGATATHVLFRSYVDAGFTETQALQITIAVMIAAARQQLGGGHDQA